MGAALVVLLVACLVAPVFTDEVILANRVFFRTFVPLGCPLVCTLFEWRPATTGDNGRLYVTGRPVACQANGDICAIVSPEACATELCILSVHMR